MVDRKKTQGYMLPSEEESKKWRPSFPQYVGQKMPEMTEREKRSIAYRHKQEMDLKKHLIAKEVLYRRFLYEKAVKEGRVVQIKKGILDDQVNDVVKKILRGKK